MDYLDELIMLKMIVTVFLFVAIYAIMFLLVYAHNKSKNGKL